MSGSQVMQTQTVYPHDLVGRIVETIWASGSEASNRAVLPSEEQIKCLLDVAWSASLLEEESRRTVFTIGFVSEEDVPAIQCRVLALAEAMPCTAHAIAKLALATDPRETVLAVQWSRKAELEIWGLLQLGGPTLSIDLEIRPRFLHVTGFRPGGLVVECHGRRLLLYMNGVAHWYEHAAENITTLLRDALHPTALGLGSTGGSLAHEFERLAERLVLSGHGGTLLVADPGTTDIPLWRPSGVHIPSAMRFRSANTCLRDAFLADEKFGKGATPPPQPNTPLRKRFELEQEHLRALDHVARLSNVDGAVVMSPDLCVYGFGATIDLTDETELPPMQLYDLTTPGALPRTITVAEFQGHRHKSAVHFCAMQRKPPGQVTMAVAIVASQDGTLSLFGLTTTGLVVFRPFILRSVSVR